MMEISILKFNNSDAHHLIKWCLIYVDVLIISILEQDLAVVFEIKVELRL